MMETLMDRLTNVRPYRRIGVPCPTCHGIGALLPLAHGRLVPALAVVPNRRAWRHLPVAPCLSCEGTGYDLGRPPRWRRWG